MKNLFTLILFLTLSGILSPNYDQWLKHTIDPNLIHATIVAIDDIDEDGDLDIAANGRDKVQWYENNSPDTTWSKHTIDINLVGANWVCTAYINDDDMLDVIATGWFPGDLNWYENPLITIPAAPILISPIGSVDSTEVEFIWTSSYPEIDWYWFEIDTTDQLTTSFVDSVITDTTSYLYSDLQDGKQYWWRVKAFNSLGWGEFSEVGTFVVTITSVEEDNQLPTEFGLDQNYPNPSNPATRIKYSIPELTFVTLKVYDVLGREAATLVNKEKSLGTYEITWYTANLPSGIYFYRLQAGSFVKTKKMILLK